MLQKRADPVKTSMHGLGWAGLATSNTFLSFSTGQVCTHAYKKQLCQTHPNKNMAWAGLVWATSIGLMEQSDTSNIHTYFTQSNSRPCQGKYGYLKWMGHDENGILHWIALLGWLVVIVIGVLEVEGGGVRGSSRCRKRPRNLRFTNRRNKGLNLSRS